MRLLIITILSLAFAVAMSVVAWRLAREERRRSEARVEALAADIHETGGEERSSPVPVNGLFTAEMRPETSPPFRALAIGVLFVGSVLAAIVVGAGRSRQHVGFSSRAVADRIADPGDAGSTRAHGASNTTLKAMGSIVRGTVVDSRTTRLRTRL